MLDRRTFLAGALASGLLAGCSSLGDEAQNDPSNWSSAPASSTSGRASSTPALPSRLSIPSISLDDPVVGLGLKSNGRLEPPAGKVQWYDATVVPGQVGISVIAGHVSWDGPDVFVRLKDVATGERYAITYADGHRENFEITRTETVAKTALQHRQDVWGKGGTDRVVVLVTCDDRSKLVGQHYENNFVVWSKPVTASSQ